MAGALEALLAEPAARVRPAWRAGWLGRADRGLRAEEDTGADVVGCAGAPGEAMIPASGALCAPTVASVVPTSDPALAAGLAGLAELVRDVRRKAFSAFLSAFLSAF